METKMEGKINIKRIFLMFIVMALGIGALVAIVGLIFGMWGDVLLVLASALAVVVYSVTGLCCSVLYEKKRFTLLAVFGMVVSMVALVYTLLFVWQVVHWEHDSYNLLASFAVLSFSFAQTCLLLLIKPVKSLVNFSLLFSLMFILIFVVMFLSYMWIDSVNDPVGLFFRFLGVVAILDALGTVITPVLNKVYSE